MKPVIWVVALALGATTSNAQATEETSFQGGAEELSALLENCKNIEGGPEAKVACFNALSEKLEQQKNTTKDNSAAAAEAFGKLRELAEYQDGETGLLIGGSGCKIQTTYFANYFHISRRNVSSIDIFSAEFDASALDYNQSANVQGSFAPLSKGAMKSGSVAKIRGGAALDSNEHNFAAKSARATIDAYASEVVGQLAVAEYQSFDFVLVHPQRQKNSAKIWEAFKSYVELCQG